MNDQEHDGVEVAMLAQFMHRALPVVMKIKDNIDAGRKLSEGEVYIMERLIHRSRNFGPIAYEFPELRDLIAKMIDLYEQIAEDALRNEQYPGRLKRPTVKRRE